MNELDDYIYYLEEVYQYVHYLDINDDDEHIDRFINSIKNGAKYQRRIKRDAYTEYDSDSEPSVSSVDWNERG